MWTACPTPRAAWPSSASAPGPLWCRCCGRPEKASSTGPASSSASPTSRCYTGRQGTSPEEMQKIADEILRGPTPWAARGGRRAPVRVILAKSAGFCYGVHRAVDLARSRPREETGGCWMLGDLIHNAHVVEELAAPGRPEDGGPRQPAGRRHRGDPLPRRASKYVLDDLDGGASGWSTPPAPMCPHPAAGCPGGGGGPYVRSSSASRAIRR